MRLLAIAVAAAALARGACITVNSAAIVAGDLAPAVPQFAPLPPETPLGFAPFPGIQRVLSSREVVAIAAQNGLSFAPGDRAPSVCVERAVRTLSAEELKPILLAALGIPDLELEILEVSSQPVPLKGRLEFRREGVNHRGDPHIPVIWRGRYLYDSQGGLSIWARVRLAVRREEIVAAEAIPVGAAITPAQLRSATQPEFPILDASFNPALTIERASGMLARRAIAAGQKITPDMLEAPKDIRRGDTVRVRVIAGAATLSLDAIAESSGNKGETIVLRNPSSGRNFRARIEAQREAVVHLPTGGNL